MSELISQADSEFQRGNFEEASSLYGRALEELSAGSGADSSDPAPAPTQAQTKEKAALLQKLGDSDYALNKFEQARQSYSDLISLQESSQAAAKDRVSVLLKFAKCLDKCDAKEEASKNFQAAYELSKLELSAKHFLRQSVADAYLDWLKTSGVDPERLAALKEELGIASNDEAESAKEDDEVKPESFTAPQIGRVAKEQEYHVMRSKITELKEKKKRKKSSGSEEDDDSSEKKALKAKEKTIEGKVSERKFLRKGEEKKDSDQRTTQRSKLRSAMTNKRDASVKDAEDFSTESINAEMEEQYASGTYPIIQTQKQQSTTESRFAEEMQISNEVRDKFVGQKPSRRLDAPENAGRKKKGVDLTIKEESAPAPEASMVFLRQSQAIRKLNSEDEVAPDVDQLRDTQVQTPIGTRVKESLKFGPPLLGLCMLVAAGVLYFKFIAPTTGGPGGAKLPAFASRAFNRNYVTADGEVEIALNPGTSTISGLVLNRPAKTRLWEGSLGDELSLLTGGFSNVRWLSVVPEGLKDDRGVTLYSMDAPERRTIAFMNTVKEGAEQAYAKENSYPAYDTEVPNNNNNYANPFSKNTEVVSVSSGVDERADESKPTELDVNYAIGEEFKNEKEHHPGAVHGVSVIAHPSHSPEGTYTWRTHCFYIRGYDRNDKLISSTTPGEDYMIILKNGRQIQVDINPIVHNYGTANLVLVDGDPPKVDLIVWKYLLILGAIVAIVLFVLRDRLLQAMKSTHKLNSDAPIRWDKGDG